MYQFVVLHARCSCPCVLFFLFKIITSFCFQNLDGSSAHYTSLALDWENSIASFDEHAQMIKYQCRRQLLHSIHYKNDYM